MAEELVADYGQECENCGATPVAVIQDDQGEIVYNYKMCGPCTFGEADCIDPANWGTLAED